MAPDQQNAPPQRYLDAFTNSDGTTNYQAAGDAFVRYLKWNDIHDVEARLHTFFPRMDQVPWSRFSIEQLQEIVDYVRDIRERQSPRLRQSLWGSIQKHANTWLDEHIQDQQVKIQARLKLEPRSRAPLRLQQRNSPSQGFAETERATSAAHQVQQKHTTPSPPPTETASEGPSTLASSHPRTTAIKGTTFNMQKATQKSPASSSPKVATTLPGLAKLDCNTSPHTSPPGATTQSPSSDASFDSEYDEAAFPIISNHLATATETFESHLEKLLDVAKEVKPDLWTSPDLERGAFNFLTLSKKQQQHLSFVATTSFSFAFELPDSVEADTVIFEGKQEIKRCLSALPEMAKLEAIKMISEDTPKEYLQRALRPSAPDLHKCVVDEFLSLDLDALPGDILCDLLDFVLRLRIAAQESQQHHNLPSKLFSSTPAPSSAAENGSPKATGNDAASSRKDQPGAISPDSASQAEKTLIQQRLLDTILEESAHKNSQQCRPADTKMPATQMAPPPYVTNEEKKTIGARLREERQKKQGGNSKSKAAPPKRPSGNMPDPLSWDCKVPRPEVPLSSGICAATQAEYDKLNQQMQEHHARFDASTADYEDSKEDFEAAQHFTNKACERTNQVWAIWKERSDDLKVHRRHSWAIAQDILRAKERSRLDKDDLAVSERQTVHFGYLFVMTMDYDQQRRMQRAIDKLALQYSEFKDKEKAARDSENKAHGVMIDSWYSHSKTYKDLIEFERRFQAFVSKVADEFSDTDCSPSDREALQKAVAETAEKLEQAKISTENRMAELTKNKTGIAESPPSTAAAGSGADAGGGGCCCCGGDNGAMTAADTAFMDKLFRSVERDDKKATIELLMQVGDEDSGLSLAKRRFGADRKRLMEAVQKAEMGDVDEVKKIMIGVFSGMVADECRRFGGGGRHSGGGGKEKEKEKKGGGPVKVSKGKDEGKGGGKSNGNGKGKVGGDKKGGGTAAAATAGKGSAGVAGVGGRK